MITTWQSIDLKTGSVSSIPSNLTTVKYAYASHGAFLYLFGGQDPNNTNSLLRVDAPSLDLSTLSEDASTPSARIFTSLVAIGENLFLFGGENQGTKYNDLWRLSTITETWTQVDTLGEMPAPRSRHAVAYKGYLMFVFGGESDQLLNDIYQYNSYTSDWSAMAITSSALPSPRSLACARYLNAKIYIYGGFDGSNYLSELWVYDLQSASFTQLASGLYALEINKCFFNVKLQLFYVISSSSDIDYKKITYYSIQTQAWGEIAGVGVRAYGSIDFIVNDSLLSLGGGIWDNTPRMLYSIYNLTTHEIRSASIPNGVFLPNIVHFGGSIYAFGGATIVNSMIFPSIPTDHFLRLDISSFYDFDYCSQGTVTNGSSCALCPEGTYSTSLNSPECLECPLGTFSKILAANTLQQCFPCNTGSWNNSTGQSYCRDCPVDQYCPYGSAYPSDLISASYYTSIQPGAFTAETSLYSYYSGLSIYLSLAVFFICTLLLYFKRIRDKLKIFDIYTSLHNHTPMIPMHIKSTRLGGCCTLMFLLSTLVFLVVTVLKFNLVNVVEVRSLVPLVTVNDQIKGDIAISINYYYYGGTCEVDGICANESTFTFANMNGAISYGCSKSSQTCTVLIECLSCILDAAAGIDIYFYEEFSFCSQISVNVTSSSSIPGETSSVQSLIGSDDDAYFKGFEPTVFSHTLIPTLFQDGAEGSSGYHVSIDTSPVKGSQYSSNDLSVVSGLGLTIGLGLTDTVLSISREAAIGMLELFSAIIGTVFGFMSSFGGILKVTEKYYEKTQDWIANKTYVMAYAKRKRQLKGILGGLEEESRDGTLVTRKRRDSIDNYNQLSMKLRHGMKQMSYITFDHSEQSSTALKNEA